MVDRPPHPRGVWDLHTREPLYPKLPGQPYLQQGPAHLRRSRWLCRPLSQVCVIFFAFFSPTHLSNRRGGNEILLDLKKTGAQQGLSRVQPDDCMYVNQFGFFNHKKYIFSYVTRAKNPWIPPPPPPEKVVQEAPPPQAAPQPLPVQPQQPMSKRERKPTTTTRTQSPTQRRQPTYIHLPVVPPVDWNGFIAYWEEQAEREMEAL